MIAALCVITSDAVAENPWTCSTLSRARKPSNSYVVAAGYLAAALDKTVFRAWALASTVLRTAHLAVIVCE